MSQHKSQRPGHDGHDAQIVRFFLPHPTGRGGPVPDRMEDYVPWVSQQTAGEAGKYIWTLKTYLQLREQGMPVALTTTFPSSGIVVSHRDFLPLFLRPRPDVFLVCIKPDRKAHTWAHFYVVQNGSDRIFRGPRATNARAVMHWPQTALIPRDPGRGTRCDNVRYFGRTLNLAAALTSADWTQELQRLGFHWQVVPSARWNDYSDTDVTVSVRGFGEVAASANPLMDPDSKPPSKLINSWLAGVPAIVGPESAFRNLRRSPLDFLEVTSIEELKAALQLLRQNPCLHRDMVAHGFERAREFSTDAVVAQWSNLIQSTVVPAYLQWMRLGRLRRQYRNLVRVSSFLSKPANLAAIRIHRPPNAAITQS